MAKMNEKAAELGMDSTHFVTCTGLHDENHYTTVRDLTKLLSYALQNDTFRQIYCTSEYTTSATASAPEGLHFLSTMFKKMDSPAVNGGEIEGGKTGYTSEAGQCLASLAKVDDVEYILVTAGALEDLPPSHTISRMPKPSITVSRRENRDLWQIRQQIHRMIRRRQGRTKLPERF